MIASSFAVPEATRPHPPMNIDVHRWSNVSQAPNNQDSDRHELENRHYPCEPIKRGLTAEPAQKNKIACSFASLRSIFQGEIQLVQSLVFGIVENAHHIRRFTVLCRSLNANQCDQFCRVFTRRRGRLENDSISMSHRFGLYHISLEAKD